jgi:hypothetical protein
MVDGRNPIWSFLRQNKKFWLGPAIIALTVSGGLFITAMATRIGPTLYQLLFSPS